MVAAAAAACWQRSSGGGQHIDNATVVGMATAAIATAVLPPRAATVAMKIPEVTALAGAQTTINNQLKAEMVMATAMAMMTAMMMAMETKATAAAAVAVAVGEAQWQRGGQRPAWWRQWQLGETATLAAVAVRQQHRQWQ